MAIDSIQNDQVVADIESSSADLPTTRAMAPPRWDGSRVLFEVASAAGVIPCAISRGALEELAGRRQSAGVGLVQCFEAARARIEAIARDKHREQPDRVGPLNIWADDVSEDESDDADIVAGVATPPAANA